MTSDHADFYVGTGPEARWVGSLAEFGPVGLSAVGRSADSGLAALLIAENADAYEAAVVGLLAHRAAQGAFAVVPGPAGEPGWPWRAATSASWYACTFAHGRVQVSFRGDAWTTPDLSHESAGPPADLPVLGDTTPKTARFNYYTFRGHPIPITQTMRPVPQTYLDRRAETALAVARAAQLVVGRRWPLADLATTAIRDIMLGQLRPGPGPKLYVLPEHVPFAYERVVAALQFLIDADRYAENNNPSDGTTLLTSAARVATQAVAAHRAKSTASSVTRLTHRTKRGLDFMGFTGSLVLARTPTSVTDLAGHDSELIGHRDDGWQLAAVTGHPRDAPAWAATLVDTTTAPVLIAVVSDSDTALLLADSPGGHRWSAGLNVPDSGTPSDAVAAVADVAVAWAAEAGHTLDAEAVLEALCAADRDNRAADQAMIDAAGDIARMSEIVRKQISFIEVYVLRVLATLGLAVPVQDPGSWWAHLAHQADTHSPG